MTISEIQHIISSLSSSYRDQAGVDSIDHDTDTYGERAQLWEKLVAAFRCSSTIPITSVPELVQAWIHEFNPGSSDGKWTTAKLDNGRVNVLTKALIALTRTLYDKALLNMFKDSTPLLLNIVLKLIEDPIPDAGLLNLALVGIKLHQLPHEFLPLVSERILDILVGFIKMNQFPSVQDEALSALERHLNWATDLLAKPDVWFFAALTLLFSEDVSARKHADAFLKQHSNRFVNQYPGDRNEIQVFVDFLSSKASDSCNMLLSWGYIVMYCGHKLHRNVLLNPLLQCVESNFNSTRPSHRIFSFNAWRRLVLNFSLNDHLFNARRLKLVLLPMWNCFKFERSYAVRQTCFDTYLYLIYHLSKRPAIKDFLILVILPALSLQNSECQLLLALMNCIASLISPSKEQPISTSQQSEDVNLLEGGPNEVLPRISCILPRTSWTPTDIDVLLKVMERGIAILKDALVPVQMIWQELCSHAQEAWNAGSGEMPKKLVQFLRKYIEPENIHALLPYALFQLPTKRALEQEDYCVLTNLAQDISAMNSFAARGTQTHRLILEWIAHAKSVNMTDSRSIEEDMLQQHVGVNPSHHLEESLVKEKEILENAQQQQNNLIIPTGDRSSPKSTMTGQMPQQARQIGKFYRQNTVTEYVKIPDRKRDEPFGGVLTERQLEKREMSAEPIALKMYSSYLNSSEADHLNVQMTSDVLQNTDDILAGAFSGADPSLGQNALALSTTRVVSNSPEADDTKRGLKRMRSDFDEQRSNSNKNSTSASNTLSNDDLESLFQVDCPEFLGASSTCLGTEPLLETQSAFDLAKTSVESLNHILSMKSLSFSELISLQKELAQVMVDISTSLQAQSTSGR